VRLALVVGALGVVFGDIGTSPIYTLQTVFNPSDPHPVPVSTENVLGVVSLVFWSVVVIVLVTYVLLAMRADNDGEGGIMALITLLRRWNGHHGGDRDRLPSSDHRCVLGRIAGSRARLPAQVTRHAYLGVQDRPDLRPVDQLAADGLGAHPGLRISRCRHDGGRPSSGSWRRLSVRRT
jgi:hypothetical protein